MNLLERVEIVLLSHGITPDHEGNDLVTRIRAGLVGCRLRISHTDRMLRCLISLPVYVPDYQRLPTAETICRINFCLYAGALEMDLSDGELRFRNSLTVIDSEPTDEEIDWLVFWSWSLVGRYAMALLEVALGSCDPEVAVAKVESSGLDLVERGSLPQ